MRRLSYDGRNIMLFWRDKMTSNRTSRPYSPSISRCGPCMLSNLILTRNANIACTSTPSNSKSCSALSLLLIWPQPRASRICKPLVQASPPHPRPFAPLHLARVVTVFTHILTNAITSALRVAPPFVQIPTPTLRHVLPVNENIASASAQKRSRRKANRRLRNTPTENLSDVATDVPSVSLTTSSGLDAPNLTQISISAPSAAPPLTEPSLDDASDTSSHLSKLLDLATPAIPLHHLVELLDHLTFDFVPMTPNHAPYFDQLIHSSSPYDSDPDFSKILTPYSPIAFKLYLEKAGISDRYPELPHKLAHGFPLGKLSALEQSFTPGNLASAAIHNEVIQAYITDELHLGRFSGPFSKLALESKIGFFRSSPVQVVVKPSPDGPKYRCCRNLSYRGKSDHSVNDEIDSDEYPTRWGTASECAKIVRVVFFINIIPSYLSSIISSHRTEALCRTPDRA
jgi:hypothetical protein